MGESPFAWAQLDSIILRAYMEQTSRMSFEETEKFREEKTRYCEEHSIMRRLKDAGYVELQGYCVSTPLWVKTRK